MRYKIYLDDFCEAIFHEMERIQDGKNGHIVEFTADDKEVCAYKIAEKLIPFLSKQLE